MKGVSEVIAIILILLIVIALAALAYTWFSGIFSTMTQTAGQNIEQNAQQMNIQFRLDSASCSANPCIAASTVSVTIRNTGQQAFDATQTNIYQGGTLKTVAGTTYSPGTCSGAGNFKNGCTATYTYAAAAPLPTCSTTVMKAGITNGLTDTATLAC